MKFTIRYWCPKIWKIAFGSDFYRKQLNIVVKCTGGNLARANYI